MRGLIKHTIFAVAVAAASLPAIALATNGAGGVSGPAFYVDGQLYRTVATPTDLSDTGAPDHSYDIIYNFRGLQLNVATSAPGMPGYNGGRWQVHALSFSDYGAALADDSVDLNDNDVLDSDEEVQAAIDAGYATDLGVVRTFVCTVVPLPKPQR